MNREEFEKWYVAKFLMELPEAAKSVIYLRDDCGGYDDPHMDGAWEAWKHCKM